MREIIRGFQSINQYAALKGKLMSDRVRVILIWCKIEIVSGRRGEASVGGNWGKNDWGIDLDKRLRQR
jgi:hypothetical protein